MTKSIGSAALPRYTLKDYVKEIDAKLEAQQINNTDHTSILKEAESVAYGIIDNVGVLYQLLLEKRS